MTIKVSELRPCDNCAGPIAPNFYVVRVSLALVKAGAVNQFLGMHQFFGGRAGAALVENFAPASTDAVIVAGDKEPSLMLELFICQACYIGEKGKPPIDLALLSERVHDAI